MNRIEKEISVITCKVCKEQKTRYQDGMFDHKNKRWVGEDGTLFNGKCCNSCHRAKQAELQRQRTAAKK